MSLPASQIPDTSNCGHHASRTLSHPFLFTSEHGFVCCLPTPFRYINLSPLFVKCSPSSDPKSEMATMADTDDNPALVPLRAIVQVGNRLYGRDVQGSRFALWFRNQRTPDTISIHMFEDSQQMRNSVVMTVDFQLSSLQELRLPLYGVQESAAYVSYVERPERPAC